DAIVYRDARGSLRLPRPRLAGAHQAMNAALAVAMLRHQEALDIKEPALRAAMGWAEWPARLQPLAAAPRHPGARTCAPSARRARRDRARRRADGDDRDRGRGRARLDRPPR